MSSTTVAEVSTLRKPALVGRADLLQLDSIWDSSGIESLREDATRTLMYEMARGRFGGIEHGGSPLFPDMSKLEGETKTFAQLTKDDKNMKQKLIASKKLLALAAQNNPEWLSNKLSNLSAWKEFSSLATGTSGPGATSVAPWTESGKSLKQWFEDSASGLDGAHLAELHNMLRSERFTRKLTNSEGKPLFGKARKGMRPAKRDASQYATVQSISSALNPTGTDETSVQIASEVTADSEWLVKKLNNMRKADGAKRKGASKSSATKERSRARSKSAPTRSEKPSVTQTDTAASGRDSGYDRARPDKPKQRKAKGKSDRSMSKTRESRPARSEPEKSEGMVSSSGGQSKRANRNKRRRQRKSERRTTGYSDTAGASASTGRDWKHTLDGGLDSLYTEPQSEDTQSSLTQGTGQSGPPSGYDWRTSAQLQTWPPPQQWPTAPPQSSYGPSPPSGYTVQGQFAHPFSPMASVGQFSTGSSFSPVRTQTISRPSGIVTKDRVYPDGTVVRDEAIHQQPVYSTATPNYWSSPGYGGMSFGHTPGIPVA